MSERPTNTDRDAWKKHWEAQEQPWRTEPEIDAAWQDRLAELHKNKRETSQGAHPFAGVKLDRADIEWMIAQYHNGNWSDATWIDNH